MARMVAAIYAGGGGMQAGRACGPAEENSPARARHPPAPASAPGQMADQRLDIIAAALEHRPDLLALGRDHRDTLDDDVGDLDPAPAIADEPGDIDRLPALFTCRRADEEAALPRIGHAPDGDLGLARILDRKSVV